MLIKPFCYYLSSAPIFFFFFLSNIQISCCVVVFIISCQIYQSPLLSLRPTVMPDLITCLYSCLLSLCLRYKNADCTGQLMNWNVTSVYFIYMWPASLDLFRLFIRCCFSRLPVADYWIMLPFIMSAMPSESTSLHPACAQKLVYTGKINFWNPWWWLRTYQEKGETEKVSKLLKSFLSQNMSHRQC